MHYYEVAVTQIIRQESRTFTYSSETPLLPGQLVRVPIGKKTLTGVVMSEVTKPTYETKPLELLTYTTPLPEPLLKLSLWLSDYYHAHLATTLQTILPRGLEKQRRKRTESTVTSVRERTHFLLNKEQRIAIDTFEHMTPGSALLHGVTGSGKTAVYIELAKQAQKRGDSTIILVPEIALTSQLVDEFSRHFSNTVVTHSRQTEAERHIAWQRVLDTTEPLVIIGPRSALFLPVAKLGYIVIDEAHEPSFKQEQTPRYSALRAASKLAEFHNAKLILGSATPSISEYYLAKHSIRPIVPLPHTAKQTPTPKTTLVDMTKRQQFKRHPFLSDTLLSAIEQTFDSKKQVLIFHNRRGSTSTTLCDECGWQAGCPRCYVPLTLHIDEHIMRCHICGLSSKIPSHCPNCNSPEIIHKGIGTKRIEAELRKLFPDKIIARFDADTDQTMTVEKQYDKLYSGEVDLIIGTQVIAKGLDLPHLRTVGVIQADAGLSLPDYGASERTFQLLAQVVGRVGRTGHETSVIIQSYQPTHPAVTLGLSQNYAEFYTHALRERQRANFPPYSFLLKLTCIYKTEKAAIANAQKLATILRKNLSTAVDILGPTPAFYERQRDTYRWQLVLKAKKRSILVDALQYVPAQHWQAELDPHSLL